MINKIKRILKSYPVLYELFEQVHNRKEIRSHRDQALHIRKINKIDDSKLDVGKRPELVIVAIIRGEDPYLIEWLEFHKMMGVEHFFIYDNGCSETTRELFAPYMETDELTYIPFPDMEGLRKDNRRQDDLSIQNMAYGDFILRYKQNCKWVLQIDIDEFAYPSAASGFETILDYLHSLPENGVMGMEIPMYVFSSDGHEKIPEGLVTESYTRRKTARHTHKSLACARYIKDLPFVGAHDFIYKIRFNKKLSDHDPVLRLNHYWIKSREEFLRKGQINSKGYMAGKETNENFNRFDNESNEQKDEGDILRFTDKLKQRLSGISEN